MIIIADATHYKEKEDLYINVRNAEGRVVSNDLLQLLPYVPVDCEHAFEWRIRSDSLNRFTQYLRKRFGKKQLKILDVGCGNGWMSHRLYKLGHKLICIDLNMVELAQAEAVFGENANLQWMYANILKDEIPNGPFDIIVLSASCQYFPDLKMLTEKLRQMLTLGGEIHLLDSMFYKRSELYAAKARSVAYYSKLGYPKMASFYFHHSVEQVKAAGYQKLFPRMFSFKNQLEWWVFKNS
jgi:SAM-dependent methyltransferase